MKTLIAKEESLKKKREEERIERSRQLKIYLKGFSANEIYLLTFENHMNYLKIILAKNEEDSYKNSAKFTLDFLKNYNSFSRCENIEDVYNKLVKLINQKDKIQIFLIKKYEYIYLIIKELKNEAEMLEDKIIFCIKDKDKKLNYDEYKDDFINNNEMDINTTNLFNSFSDSPIISLVTRGITNKLLGRKRDYFDYDIYNINKQKRVKNKINNKNKFIKIDDENNINNNKNKKKILKDKKIKSKPLEDDIMIIDEKEFDRKKKEKFILLEEASKYIDIEIDNGQEDNNKIKNIFNVHKQEKKEYLKVNNKAELKNVIKDEYKLTPEEIKNLFQKRNNYHKLNKYHLEKNELFKSRIIKNETEMNLILSTIKYINKDFENQSMKYLSQIYTTRKDGTSSYSFHTKCDYKSDLLILIKTRKRIIFGGYTKKYFDSEKNAKKIDYNSFLFNLNNMKVYLPCENRYDPPGISNLINNGPNFLNNAIYIGKNLVNDIGKVGRKNCGYKFKYDFELNNGNEFFNVEEIEIYQILFDKFLSIK